MRRLVAALTILLFLVTPLPPVKATGTTTVWATDQAINDSVTVEAGDTLRIESGVNVTFEVPFEGDQPDQVPSLTVNGTLEVNGTTERQVDLWGGDDLPYLYSSPAFILVDGHDSGQGARFSNTTFTDLELILQDCAADFSNCTFNNSVVEMTNSTVRVSGSVFLMAFITNAVNSVSNSVEVVDCRFAGPGANSEARPAWTGYTGSVAIEGYGWTKAENCTISDYGCGIECFGLTIVEDSTISGCNAGIVVYDGSAQICGCNISGGNVGLTFDQGKSGNVSIDIWDCTVSDCEWADVSIGGEANITNCTFSGSLYGIEAGSSSPVLWIFSGNTFINDTCAIDLEGEDADMANNTFLWGDGAPEYCGRVEMSSFVDINVSDPSGAQPEHYYLNWTDDTGFQRTLTDIPHPWISFEFYYIDESGNRTDYYPYSVYVETEAGRSQTESVTPDTRNITLVIPYSNDLLPANLTVHPTHPVAGDYLTFNVTLDNFGARNLSHVLAIILVDGVPLDSANITTFAASSSASPRFLEWKATKGRHVVEVRVDPDNVINEYNETNNDLTITLVIRPAPQKAAVDLGRTIIWAGAGAVGLAIIAAIFVRMRRKPGG